MDDEDAHSHGTQHTTHRGMGREEVEHLREPHAAGTILHQIQTYPTTQWHRFCIK